MADTVVLNEKLGGRGAVVSTKTITDADTVAKLLALAAGIEGGDNYEFVKMTDPKDRSVVEVVLPRPVGICTQGKVQVWGRQSVRRPDHDTSMRFCHPGDKSARDLAELVHSLMPLTSERGKGE